MSQKQISPLFLGGWVKQLQLTFVIAWQILMSVVALLVWTEQPAWIQSTASCVSVLQDTQGLCVALVGQSNHYMDVLSSYWRRSILPVLALRLSYIWLFGFSDILECRSSPCTNGGTCMEMLDGYQCQCANGFTGVNCETGTQISTSRQKN